MKRAALYARVSTERQSRDDRNSLAVQRAAYLDRCTAEGYVPAGEWQDIESGRRATRPGYQKMLAEARAGRIDVIVVTYLDRFGRDQWEIMARLGELRSLGVEVDAIYEDSREFIFVALGAWKAEQESQRIGERVRIATRRAVANGSAVGTTPYGYRRDEARRLTVYEPEARIVRDIYTWYVRDNMGYAQIARRLNERGVRTGRDIVWTDTAVGRIVRRRTYTGDFRWGETVARDVQPAIVERELWEQAQERRRTKARLPRGQTHTSEFLLTGIIYCGHCGGRMNGHTAVPPPDTPRGREGTVYRGYQCASRLKAGTCATMNYHPAGPVEQQVVELLVRWDAGEEGQQDGDLRRVEGLEAALRAVEAEADAVAREFRENVRLFHSGAFATEEQFRTANQLAAERQQRVEAERARLSLELAEAQERAARTAARPSRLRDLARQLPEMAPQQVKALMQEYVERVVLYDGDPEPRVTLR